MSLLTEVRAFMAQLLAMNRKLDQIIDLLKMLVEMQAKEQDDDEAE